MSALESAAARELPASDDLAGTFTDVSSAAGRSQEEIGAILADLHFGTIFTDHMARLTYREGEGWHNPRLEDYGPLSLDPSAAVLHYGQEVFEGLKAYRHADGSLWTFRPGYNAARFNASARRMAMPEIDPRDFLGSIIDLVRADGAYVPQLPGALYLRPYMFSSEPFLGVRAARDYEFLTIASPVGAYFTHGFQPVDIWVDDVYHRAGPGGTGEAKTSGNYAASLLPQQEAAERGFEQVCFLDSTTGTLIEELGGMNVFVSYRDGSVATPALSGTILEGGTRSAILRLLADRGVVAREVPLPLAQLLKDLKADRIAEIFACGTAAVVTPIGRLAGREFDVQVPTGELTVELFDELTGIQAGTREDTYGWMYRLS
ncbi:MAG: branched-chain amino acid aminotransferase [Bowdeniella nasicola]|nr:branched-chain amino acid aminotransferase [Bowdeniella nasicola]